MADSVRIVAKKGPAWGRRPEGRAFTRAVEDLVEDVATTLHGHATDGVVRGRSEWPPLAAMTVAMKGHNKPLVDSGDFLRAIEMRRDGTTATVGVHGGRGSKGQELGLVAIVMENGATVRVTDRMRGWFLVKGFPLSPATEFIRIPARPVFGPAMKETDEEMDRIIGDHVGEMMEAAFGA